MNRKKWTNEKLFEQVLKNKTEKAIWSNIKELRIRPTLDVFNKCVELTKSKISKRREIGINILAQLREKENSTKYLTGKLLKPYQKETVLLFFDLLEKEENLNVIETILWSIGHNNSDLNELQIAKLCSFVDYKKKSIKDALVFSLLTIDKPIAYKTLIKLSSDKAIDVRNWATFGLGTQIERNNKEIREALWNRINDKDETTRFEAIVGLANRKDLRIKEVIIKELHEKDYGSLIFDAILNVGDVEILTILKKQLKIIKKETDINESWLQDLNNCIKELSDKLKVI